MLTAYGVDVTEEQVRRADAQEIKEKVNESRREQETEDEKAHEEETREENESSQSFTPRCSLREPVL